MNLSTDPAFLFTVEGQVAVVTGGGTGIGLMIATALEHNGATVYIVGRRLDVLEKAASEHNRHGKIIPLQGDITSRESLLTMVQTVKARHGFIDLLVNNAGIARNLLPPRLPSPLDETDISTEESTPSIKQYQDVLWNTGGPIGFAETFETNVTAIYYTTVAFLELLHLGNLRRGALPPLLASNALTSLPRPTSQVITVSSSGSFRVDARVLSISYTLAKHACTHLGKLLANLLADWNIRSNVLCPGVWPSEMTTLQHLTPTLLAQAVPLGRAGTLSDMAGPILFLAGRAGAYVNGAVWLVDGGRIGQVASSY
ncbi:hypothetical protein HYDPIDRAFT_94295 [Hydnomerulius pinastri MD-312]|uniref:NAD(P)-binding protein n=1 Tax=Hydnomerulius pinastri MD-312 TaxID=994086 RepID=A0A0C9VWX5_9AGAM|nr:hypothetical protein HYDPIDRAFT_94295 [Hydnomerulius pinastri MD-312]